MCEVHFIDVKLAPISYDFVMCLISSLYSSRSHLDDGGQKGENLEQDELRAALKKLTLSNEAVWNREKARPPVEAPWWILGPYYLLCLVRNLVFPLESTLVAWSCEILAHDFMLLISYLLTFLDHGVERLQC